MGVDRLMTTPCTVLGRAPSGETDEFGNPTKKPVEVETYCSLQQASAAESDLHGEISDTVWKLFLPIDTQVDTGDAVVVDERKYELIGDPWELREGSRAMWHIEALVQRTAAPGDDGASE
jgi:hypothetical protein